MNLTRNKMKKTYCDICGAEIPRGTGYTKEHSERPLFLLGLDIIGSYRREKILTTKKDLCTHCAIDAVKAVDDR